MSTQDLRGRNSKLLQRYQSKAVSQDPLQQPVDTSPFSKSTSQRSLQHSTLLQKHYAQAGSQNIPSGPPAPADPTLNAPSKITGSQRSLERSKLLQRYTKQHSLDSQDVPKAAEPQIYSSQKSLEGSKLLQRYNPNNRSQDFAGLSAREGTPVARFARSGSLDQDRIVRPSLLSRYTPRFGKSLDRNKSFETEAYSSYSSQHSLDQQDPMKSMTQSQTLGDYGSDHFDQYDSRNLRSRSSSMAKGLSRRSGSRELLPSSKRVQLEKENIPLDPVTPETLPIIAAAEPVMGNIASALPMPMLNIVPPTPVVEVSPPPMQPTAQTLPVQPAIVPAEPIKPARVEPVKPPRKDLSASTTVSIPIPAIKTTINVEPPLKPIIKQETRAVPKDPSPPLFSDRDRMQHYGSASKTLPSSALSSKSIAPISQTKKATILLPPVSDLSGRRSLTDLRKPMAEDKHALALEIDEASERNELRRFSLQKEPIKRTLASAFENVAALSVPHAVSTHEDEDEVIETLPTDRKLKKRDHTYHPSFVPKQTTKQQDAEMKKLEDKIKLEMKKIEHDRKKEEERIRKEEERLRRERDKQKRQSDKIKSEEEKRLKEDDKKIKLDEEKRRKEESRLAKEEEKKMKTEEEKLRKEEEKFAKEEEKRLKDEERRKKEEEKKKQKEEKKKGVLKKSLSADQEPAVQLEDEPIDFGSHLEQYSITGPEKPKSISTSRGRFDATPVGSQRALNRHTLPTMSKPIYSSQQSLDRATGIQSKMLQRYAKRSGSQDYTHTSADDDTQKFLREVNRSQGSLDQQRITRSSLLQKYTPKPLSASTSPTSQPPASATPATTTTTTTAPKTPSELSLDRTRLEKSSLLQRYSKPRSESTEPTPSSTISEKTTLQTDKEQRLSAVVFHPKKRPEKYDAFDYRDHEYEPIGEAIDTAPEPKPAAAVSLALPGGDIKRKLSSASLRVPDDDADTLSMEELQKDIEDRYFNRQTEEEHEERTDIAESAESPPEKGSKMKAVMARAQQSGKKAMARAQESSKSAMVKAQAGGKSLHQKLRKQTDKFKTKMSNINVKKDKDVAPLASPEIVTTPEIERLDFTIAEPKSEQETGEIESPTVTIAVEQATDLGEESAVEPTTGKKKFKGLKMPKLQKPEFKRPEFTKISKPKMPKLKTPDMSKFKRPEMPKFLTEKPDFSKLKMPEKIGTIKLHRSKSLKEPASAPGATSPTDIETETPSVTSAEDSKKKVAYTDFSTYPRFLDKFKRQKSAPGNASIRASTPPPLEFSKAGKTTRTKGPKFISRWAEKSSEDTESTRFFSGSELGERESSVEKRMRQRLERTDFDTPELPVTAEQKQLEEYDKENREIHLLSAARHDEFLKRKPPMERQESDLASEEEKQFWASSLGQKIRQNIDMNSNDFDFLDEEDRLRRENETMGLSDRDRARFLGEPAEHSEKDYDMRSTTPYSNKECQSSGSSGIRRRKGVLEEIDDDEFFLRQKGISKDNIQMGEYISSAIKEGLSTPTNALAEMGRYEPYDDEDLDVSERASMDYRGEGGARGLRYYQPSFESDDVSNKQSFTDEFHRDTDFFKTFPPDRPVRKNRKEINVEPQEQDIQKVPYDTYQPTDRDDEVEFYTRNRKYASEPPQGGPEKDERYIDEESIGAAVPPTPPRRRKKRFRDVAPSDLEPFANGLTKKTIYNSFTIGPETLLYPAEVPLAEEESFTTPLPTPRRSRSRSQLSKFSEDDRAFRTNYVFGFEDSAMDRGTLGMSESNGYAVVRKEPPPRPPAPIRRRKSTRSLEGQRQFNTLPNYHSVSPMRPIRNYSTISPNRPPRNRSVSSLNENQPTLTRDSREDVRQYEEIEDMENQIKLQQALQSGAVVSKMKDRPLPPPPRPPREGRKTRKQDIEDDFDGGAERIVVLDQHGPRVVEEVEIAIQTDPVSDDYELDIEVSETIGAIGGDPFERPSKTLQEILKEEQQAEIDRARQLAEADNLMKNIQKFRDSTSSLSLQGSRPETPAAAVLIERRVSTPYSNNSRAELASAVIRPVSTDNLTEQDLADDDTFIAELVKKYVSDEKVTETPKKQPKFTTQAVSDAVEASISREERAAVQSEPAAPPRRRSLVASSQDLTRSVDIPSNVIEEIVERLRTNEQQHIAELHQLHQQQLEDLRKHQEEQRQQQEQKLEEQQKQLLQQQNQQLQETQQLKEQILLQQEQQKALLQQQQQQQQQLLLAQQQQQILLEQQEKERELQRERERELLREREIELEKARDRERELHHARELELQRARDLEQQRAKELEQQRLRELELQRAMEMEHQRLRELEIQRIQEAEAQRAREVELQRAREIELQKARETEMHRIREVEAQRIKELELLATKETDSKESEKADIAEPAGEADVPQIPDTEKPVQEATSVKSETIKEPAPVRPPLPHYTPQPPMATQYPYQEYLQFPLPPQAFYPGRNYSDDEGAAPQAPQRRRRHHRSRRESTSEEEFQREQRKQRPGTRSPEPSIPALSSQLIRACGSSIRQTGEDLMALLRASSKDENKRDLHIALIILIVIVAGLMALGMSGEKAVHHHHWDYFNPPGNSGKA